MKNLTTKKLTYLALFSALVYIATRFFQIQIPTPFGNTMFHLGNVFCVLAGLILGPIYGGLAAGIGSGLYDLFDPIYFTSTPITFITKFAMAYVAGKVYYKNRNYDKKHIAISAIAGQLTYTFLYLLKTFITNYFILGFTMEATLGELSIKAGVSLTNAVISIIFSSLLAIPLLKNIKLD